MQVVCLGMSSSGYVPRAIDRLGQLSECGEAVFGEGALGGKHATANQP